MNANGESGNDHLASTKSSSMTKHEYFHFAKLSLFNVRLMAEIEGARTRDRSIGQLVNACIDHNELTQPVSLMHQMTLLGHAYTILVWLREYVWESFGDVEKATFADRLNHRYDWQKGITDRGATEEGKDMTKPDEVIYALRNAIAHARVEFDENDNWVFTNSYRASGTGERHTVRLVLTFGQLGALCHEVMFAYQDVLYPSTAEAKGPG